MSTVKSIVLLELLYKQSSVNRDKIIEMFVDTVDKTDIYVRLENIVNSNIFIGQQAENLYRRACELLQAVRVNPKEAIGIFFELEELVITLEAKKEQSEKALEECDFFCEIPSVVSKIVAATTTKFYENLYKAITYLSATLHGVSGLRAWSAFPMGSFTDLMHFTDEFLPEKVKSNLPIIGKWSIGEKYCFGGRAGASYTGCEVRYEDDLAIKKIGTAKHPYLRAAGLGEQKNVEGFGYIIGVGVNDINALFEGELINEVHVTNVTVDPLVIDSNIIYNPVEFLTHVLGTNKFVLSPDVYVKLLNKYFLNSAILQRKNSSKCLLCGRSLSDVNVTYCRQHFDYTQNED